MYDVKSRVATEFIDDKEILDTIAYAKQNKSNRELIERLINRAKDCKGLTHREAAVLLECDQADLNEQMFQLAKQIKQKLYGNRIVMFAPLYLSNYCVNGCTYCPYHYKNKTVHYPVLLRLLPLKTVESFYLIPQSHVILKYIT